MENELASILVRKFARLGRLSRADERMLAGIPIQLRDVAGDQDLVREGDRPTQCILLVDGFAARHRTLSDGRRQILSFHIPGDFLDLQSYTLNRIDHSIGTLTAARVAYVPHSDITELTTSPNLARLMWHDTLVDGAIFREWVVNVGRRTAYQRVAHVLCEFVTRMQAVGLAPDGICDLPLTQAEIADATGLSTVHVNRVLQELRRENLIIFRGRLFSAPNWPGLQLAAEFDSSYLQLESSRIEPPSAAA